MNLNDNKSQDGNKKLSNKINMEAYQAYYNTNDSMSAKLGVAEGGHYNEAMVEGKDGEQNMKIINNITHISTQNVY